MIEWYDKENKNQQQASGNNSVLQNGVVKAPDYSTKARN